MRNPAFAIMALGAATLGLPTDAHAQYFDGPAYAFPVTDMMGPAMSGVSMNSYIKNSKSTSENSGARKPKPAPQAPKASLDLGSDPAVSKAVKASFRSQLVRSNPSKQAAIDQALARDWLAGYRAEIARPNGLDATNLADAVTAYSIAIWAIANKQTTIRPQTIGAVRDTMRREMAVSAQTARLSPQARQKMGEELMYQTVLIMANRTEIARTGSSQMADAAARHYRNAAITGMSVDPAKLDLTDRGFVSR